MLPSKSGLQLLWNLNTFFHAKFKGLKSELNDYFQLEIFFLTCRLSRALIDQILDSNLCRIMWANVME